MIKKIKKNIGYGLVVFFYFLITIYSINTNCRYYDKYGPFYDSLSYCNAFAFSCTNMQDNGIIAGIITSSHNINGFIPITIAALGSYFFGLNRVWGILGNSILMLLCSSSIYFYLYKTRKLPIFYSASVAVLMVSINITYFPVGGLADFRMDLALYFCFGFTVACYLMTYFDNTIKNWIYFSIALVISLLTRSTSIIYFLFSLGPLLLIRFISESRENKINTLKGVGVCCLITFVFSGWFYFLNYKDITYYYLIWNRDSVIHLPLNESIKHVALMISNIGWSSWGIALVLATLKIFVCKAASSKQQISRQSFFLCSMDWKCLWIGISILLLFVIRGAGLNPYVSFPAGFGFLAFLYFPGPCSLNKEKNYNKLNFFALLLLVTNFFISMYIGNKAFLNLGDKYGKISAYKEMISLIIKIGKKIPRHQIVFDCPVLGVFSLDAIDNILMFNYGFKKENNCFIKNELTIKHSPKKILAVCPQEWTGLLAESKGAYINYISEESNKLDIIILPNKNTAIFLNEKMKHIASDEHIFEIMAEILTKNQFRKLTQEFLFNKEEQYNIYCNNSNIPSS